MPIARWEPPRPSLPDRPPRVVVENVAPVVDGGRFPVKRIVGERLVVEADVLADGHEVVAAALLHRAAGDATWTETPMERIGNDRWRGSFVVERLAPHSYTVQGWIDPFQGWRDGLSRKVAAGTVEPIDLLVGAKLLEEAAARASGPDAERLAAASAALASGEPLEARVVQALDDALLALAARHADRRHAGGLARELTVDVDRERARVGAWYELFPRSAASEPGRHGTLRDVVARLPYVASMGFDVLYLPPVHPIGRTFRKGRNNAVTAAPGDVGSPWAIGAAEGGHTAIHPELGDEADLRALVEAARGQGLEVAMDLAFQCAPDHPWVREHPEWFHLRPDGSVQYAENPPKKYQDIYPLEFEGPAWRELWQALLGVVLHWAELGVRIFRVDNPHTKPFRFWEWLIAEARREAPDLIFLAEAFTRPKVMYQLAKLGFAQSYTYFAWRNTKGELTGYLQELTEGEARHFFRPNFWPNTPDILPEPLQHGGRVVFQQRLVLAATLGASYGIYGPAFELLEGRALRPGSEEYLDSEKYELRAWELERPDSLRDFIARVNRIRREHPALQTNEGLRFHRIDNEQLLAYSKVTADGSDVVLAIVNLDPHHVHSGFLELPLEPLGLDPAAPYQVHDLLGGGRYYWHGARNYVEIDPRQAPAQLFFIRRRVRTEHDFDYFL